MTPPLTPFNHDHITLEGLGTSVEEGVTLSDVDWCIVVWIFTSPEDTQASA